MVNLYGQIAWLVAPIFDCYQLKIKEEIKSAVWNCTVKIMVDDAWKKKHGH